MSDEDTKKGSHSYAAQRAALERWPHSLEHIEETLDTKIIEGRGKQILFRSLNLRNVVAFVGSGMSVSYGRLSWSALLDAQLNQTGALARKFRACAKESATLLQEVIETLARSDQSDEHARLARLLRVKHDEIRFKSEEIGSLEALFKSLRSETGPHIENRYPIVFQIAERLQEALLSAETLFIDRGKFGPDGRRKRIEENEAVFRRHLGRAEWGFFDNRKLNAKLEKLVNPVTQAAKKNFETAFNAYFVALTIRGANLTFIENTKLMVADELPHAQAILREGLLYGRDAGRARWEDVKEKPLEIEKVKEAKFEADTVPKKIPKSPPNRLGVESDLRAIAPDWVPEGLRRDFDAISRNPERFNILGCFKSEAVTTLVDQVRTECDAALPASWKNLLDLVAEEAGKNFHEGESKQFVSPTHRFVVAFLLALMKDPLDTPRRWPSREKIADPDIRHNDCLWKEVRAEDFRSRASIVDDDLDPLRHLAETLKIDRFLTTNYDMEIERLFQDRGYQPLDLQGDRPTDLQKTLRYDSLGGYTRDTQFERDRAIDLVSFSVGHTGADASVFHLHGRATRGSDIVVTERHYMDLYLRNDDERDLVNEAISLVFSSSPILFVGLGLSEPDVMRPLRQFISDQERRGERTAIALMPALQDREARDRVSASAFVRYGVHIIYYGAGEVRMKDGYIQTCDWLFLVQKLVGELMKRNNALAKCLQVGARFRSAETDEGDSRPNEEKLRDLKEQWKTLHGGLKFGRKGSADRFAELRKALEEPEERARIDVLDPLFGHRKTTVEILLNDKALSLAPATLKPEGIRDIEIDDSWMRFERRTIGEMLRFVLTRTLPGVDAGGEEIREALRQVRAAEIALKGAGESIFSGCLTQAIANLGKEWAQWWDMWREPPPARVAVLADNPAERPSPQRLALPRRQVRHEVRSAFSELKVDAPIRDWEDSAYTKNLDEAADDDRSVGGSGNERLYVRQVTGIRSFDTFLASLETASEKLLEGESRHEIAKHRRIHLVLAHRGLGKGTFFSAFSSKAGLSQFIASSWRCGDVETGPRPEYAAAVFLNLGFSTEIASIFDTLIDAIRRATLEVTGKLPANADAAEILKKVQEDLVIYERLARLDRLRLVLNEWKDAVDQHRKERKDRGIHTPVTRMLLAFNAVDVLLKENGAAKNREIGEFLEFLTGDNRDDFPLDIVFVGDEHNLPEILRSKVEKSVSKSVAKARDGGGADPSFPQDTSAGYCIIQRASITSFGRESTERRIDKIRLSSKLPNAAEETEMRAHKATRNTIHVARVMKAEKLLVDNFLPLAIILFIGTVRKRVGGKQDRIPIPKDCDDAFKAACKMAEDRPPLDADLSNKRGLGFDAQPWEKLFRTFCCITEVHEWLINDDSFKDEAWFGKIANAQALDHNEIKRVLMVRYERERKEQTIDRYDTWNQVRYALNHNRFTLTVLLAAAQHLMLDESAAEDGATQAEKFILRTLDHVAASSSERREELILEEVMSVYQRRHKAGSAALDIDLHRAILRNIAIVGTPVSADVLAAAPTIQSHIANSHWEDGSEVASPTDHLEGALRELLRRGLVFAIVPNPRMESLQSKDYADHASRHRFVLHRLMHRLVIRKMGGSLAEFIRTNSFAPNLYASLPTELPKPTYEGYRFMRQAAAGLSGYPERNFADGRLRNWTLSMPSMPTRVQALRAALGIVRSAFSAGVVSRFDEYAALGSDWTPRIGYFREHRMQVRWLLRQGWELYFSGPKGEQLSKEEAFRKSQRHLKPFYIDEIVWLYNENGMICLVQGDLTTAIALLRQAIDLNRRVESNRDGGPQHNRISLNLAIVQLERGRLDAARHRLENIRDSEEHCDTHIHWLARGYLALHHHLTGEFERARTGYREVIEAMQQRNDRRALSIFLRHRGDLMRRLKDHEKARSFIKASMAHARAGGFEDLAKKSMLAEMRIVIALGLHPRDQATVMEKLSDIESYARIMEIPSLLCESKHIRAEILLAAGETKLAGTLAQEIIGLACRNQMVLRMTAALNLYSEIIADRGHDAQSRQLALTVLDLVKATGAQIIRGEAVGEHPRDDSRRA